MLTAFEPSYVLYSLRWYFLKYRGDASRLAIMRPGVLENLDIAITVCFLILMVPRTVSAHAPHDEVSAILVSPSYIRDGIVFAIVRYSILKSIDFGFTWRRLTRGLPRCDFRELAISPSFATDGCLFAASPAAGIFGSLDAGLSWEPLKNGLHDSHIVGITISHNFVRDRRLLALGYEGELFVTNDAGTHWRHLVCNGIGRVSATGFVENSIAVGTFAGAIHASDDGGLNWQKFAQLDSDRTITCLASSGNPSRYSDLLIGSSNGCVALGSTKKDRELRAAGLAGHHVTSILLTSDRDNNPVLFATTWREAVFRSEDMGLSWQKHAAGLTTDRQADWPQFRRPHFKGLAVSGTFATDQTVFVGGFDGVFKSTDGGRSWREMRETLSTGLIVGMDIAAVSDADSRVAISTYLAGVYGRSADDPWAMSDIDNESCRLSDIASSPEYRSDKTIFALGNWDLFRSFDGGQSWETTTLLRSARTLPQLKSRFQSTLRRMVPMLTTCCGKDRVARFKQWFACISTRAGMDIMGPGWGGTFAVSPHFSIDRTLFIGGPLGVLRSQDGGISFESVFQLAGSHVRSLVVSPDFPCDGTVFVAYEQQLYRSIDRGSTWQLWYQGQNLVSPRLVISPAYSQDQSLFLGADSGLWRSTDSGKTWRQLTIATVAADASIDGLAISPNFHNDHEIVVHVCGKGLFHSHNEGNTFTPIQIENVIPSPAASHMMGFPDRASLIRFSPHYANDKTIFISSMEDLLKSADSGKTWELVRRPVRFKSQCAQLTYRGSWRIRRRKLPASKTANYSATPGDTANFEFIGREIRWIGEQGPDHGVARVFIDDKFVTTVDQYAEARSFATVSFETRDLLQGPHTISIHVTSEKNSRSSGNDIVIDAFDVI
jgi:photosystem II stability/assembly factor-like uncharacterized protein